MGKFQLGQTEYRRLEGKNSLFNNISLNLIYTLFGYLQESNWIEDREVYLWGAQEKVIRKW